MKAQCSFQLKQLLILPLFILAFSNIVHGQFYVGGGVNLIKGFTVKKPYLGINLFAEKIEEDQSLYANLSASLKQNEMDEYFPINSSLGFADSVVIGNLSYRYNTLELGKRNYYYSNDLDFGLAVYLAEHITVSYNTVAVNLSSYNTANYHFPSTIPTKGNILCFALGANAGLQYAFVRGIVFGDLGFNYNLIAMPNNLTSQNSNSYSAVNFTFQLGVKKILSFSY